MRINKGYLSASTDSLSDERYTPMYAVIPIAKYIPKNKIIWCPFDTNESAFYLLFKSLGYNVICSCITNGQDFFNYEPDNYDVIISNPPFSKKDPILKRLYELNKPFAMLLPLNILQGSKRYELFCRGIQLLAFDKRICYYDPDHFDSVHKNVPFASAYFCYNFLPKDLILEHLEYV